MKVAKQEKETKFDEILSLIKKTRTKIYGVINTELIKLYWQVGERLWNLSQEVSYGDKVIDEVSSYIALMQPDLKGFTRPCLYRMKQFYAAYKDDKYALPLLKDVSWSNHLLILCKAKDIEERHFYLTHCVTDRYSKRELERQIDSAYYERYVLSSKRALPASTPKGINESILDTYILDFLDLPSNFDEKSLRKAIIENLKKFILEFGKDFTFVGEEYRLHVGLEDYSIDLLFFNRSLSCLVPIELKTGRFRPEYIGQINFYMEALDRDVKKANENPSVGLVLCASKDDMVVEYALSRSISPTLVSEYTFALPDKKLLKCKMREIADLAYESVKKSEN